MICFPRMKASVDNIFSCHVNMTLFCISKQSYLTNPLFYQIPLSITLVLYFRLNRGRMTSLLSSTIRLWRPWMSWVGRRGSLLWSGASWLGTCSTGEPKLCPSEWGSLAQHGWVRNILSVIQIPACMCALIKLLHVLSCSLLESDPEFGFDKAKRQLEGIVV